jgi:hypothetical protein
VYSFDGILMMQSGSDQLTRLTAARGLETLRLHVLPALRTYDIAGVEVCYDVAREAQVVGIQFRDASGRRVERLAVPSTLTLRLNSCVLDCVEVASLDEGQGVVSIDLVGGRLTLQHFPTNDVLATSRLEVPT